jgi:peptidoglycan-associated lipoprotein
MPDARFKYAQMLKMNGKYADARAEFQLYISEAENIDLIKKAKRELAGCELAMELDPVPGLTITNAGKKVNSKYSEYSPVLVDGDKMYFTAIQADEVIVIEDAKEDFHSKAFVSNKTDKGWNEPSPLSVNVNREGYHIGNLCLSDDGERLYFTRALLTNSLLTESKLYVSKKGSNGWEGANLVEGVNGDYLVRQPAEGELYGDKVLFFTSNMGDEGGTDIYYSTLKGGTYSTPVNLGDVINTDGEEETPFYRDGTLYFSSTGHVGIGGFDIFSSTWDGKNWSEPVNMGKGYNSPVDDLYFSIDKEGYNGFLISNREGTKSAHGKTCCNDIWTVSKEKIVVQLVATTFSEKEPLNGVTVTLIETADNVSGDPVVNTKENTNSFSFPINRDVSYFLVAQKEGFVGDTITFETMDITASMIFEKQLFLTPEEPEYETFTINQPIELENIFYDFDKWDILPDAEKDLAVLDELMVKYPDLVIELSSHTDSRGKTRYNQRLSQKRAESAKTWLTDHGIAEDRIKAVGYGEAQIRNKCVNGVKCSDEEHRFNRRTEFKIIAGPTSIQIEKTRLKKKGKN